MFVMRGWPHNYSESTPVLSARTVWAGGVWDVWHCPPTGRGSGMNSTLDKVSITFGR